METDEEFRFAVMDMIGVHEILKRLDIHYGLMANMQEQIKTMQEQMVKMQGEINGLHTAVDELRGAVRENTKEIKSLTVETCRSWRGRD